MSNRVVILIAELLLLLHLQPTRLLGANCPPSVVLYLHATLPPPDWLTEWLVAGNWEFSVSPGNNGFMTLPATESLVNLLCLSEGCMSTETGGGSSYHRHHHRPPLTKCTQGVLSLLHSPCVTNQWLSFWSIESSQWHPLERKGNKGRFFCLTVSHCDHQTRLFFWFTQLTIGRSGLKRLWLLCSFLDLNFQ